MATSLSKEDTYKSQFEYQYREDYFSDWTIHRNYINQNFDAWESMLTGQVYDTVSRSIDGSKITDSYAMTLAKERADRVIAKLPEGLTEPTGKADVGKAAFMDILRVKYIQPNANAQHPYLEKLNLWQFYSSVYGYMPMFYDWNVTGSGYAGPDCWLWNPRNLIPQQGRTSIAEMEYVTALTYVNKAYLKGILDGTNAKSDEDGWDREAIRELLEREESYNATDQAEDTKVTRDRQISMTKRGIKLCTRFEAGQDGEWITFAPDHGYCEVRRIKNPHKNGRIPFVIKYSQPLFDSFYGLGDFQRAMPLQFARDGLTNFYFQGIKMNLIPPIVANANGVVKHTLDYRPGGVILETIPNSVRRLETSNAGLSTYQAAQTSLTGSLLAQYGSQNPNAPGADTLNPSQGRTPAAISLYSDKEATRDGAERRHLESAIQQLTEGFFDLVVNIGTEEIPVSLFRDDIEEIMRSGLSDVQDIFTSKNIKPNSTGTAAELKIKPSALKGVGYRFKVNPDSSAKINQQMQLQALLDMIDRLGKYQNVLQNDPTITIHWDKIMTSFMALTDIGGADQFITFDPNAQPPAPEPQQPSPTSVTMPGGQVHESADLVKLYSVSEGNVDLQNAILQAMGLPPAAQPLPEAPIPEQAPIAPTVSKSGHIFRDASLASAADALHDAASPLTSAPMQPPAAPTAGAALSGAVQ